METVAYHEGAPGHHFQIAIQQELEGVPTFQKFAYFGSYVEGWGLYAERLAKEEGRFTDPLQDFGRLQNEMLRAARLVVDTGAHSKQWTREQMIEYMTREQPDEGRGGRPRKTSATSTTRARRSRTRSACSRSSSCASGEAGARREVRHPRLPRRRAEERRRAAAGARGPGQRLHRREEGGVSEPAPA